MNRRRLFSLTLAFAAALALAVPGSWAQQAPAAAAADPASPALPAPKLADPIKLPVPRVVRAAEAALGMGRPRLALVIGNGLAGSKIALDSAPRDSLAVATALRAAGFVVMVREDSSAEGLRADLQEFHDRLQPASVGFVYFTGLGAQVGGQNYLLARGVRPEAGAIDAQLKAAGLPLQELADAVQGPAGSPRFLVVDAAYQHPALAGLAEPGLSEPKSAPGLMALLAAAPGAAVETHAVDALPTPPPSDPRQLAASRFGRELVRALVTPRLAGAEILRLTRSAVLDSSQGQQVPFIVGQSDDKDEFAEPGLLDALLPRSPEDLAREAVRQLTHLSSGSRGGDMPVNEVLAQSSASTAAPADKGGDPVQARPGDKSSPNATPLSAVAEAAAAAAAVAGAPAGGAKTGAGAAAPTATMTAATAQAAMAAASTATSAAGSVASAGEMSVAALTAAFAAASPPVASPAVAMPAVSPPAAAAPAMATKTATPQAARAPVAIPPTPAYTPRTNAYGYAVGDSYSYRVLDRWTGRVLGAIVQIIDAVADNGDLVVNGRQTELDAQGRTKHTPNIDGSRSEFQPAQEFWWSNPKRGESRNVNFKEVIERPDRPKGLTEWRGSLDVGRLRTIELPAGKFEAMPIEGGGWLYERTLSGGLLASRKWSRTVWYAPKLGHPVAIDIEECDISGRLQRRERIELTHAQTSRMTR